MYREREGRERVGRWRKKGDKNYGARGEGWKNVGE